MIRLSFRQDVALKAPLHPIDFLTCEVFHSILYSKKPKNMKSCLCVALLSFCVSVHVSGSVVHELLNANEDYVPIFETLIQSIRNDSRAFDTQFIEEVDVNSTCGNAVFRSHRFHGLETLQWPLKVSSTRKGNHIFHVRCRWSMNAPMIIGSLQLVQKTGTGKSVPAQSFGDVSLLFPSDLSFVIVLHINHQYGKVGVTVVAEATEKSSSKFVPIIDHPHISDSTQDPTKCSHSQIEFGLRDGIVRLEKVASALRTRISATINA